MTVFTRAKPKPVRREVAIERGVIETWSNPWRVLFETEAVISGRLGTTVDLSEPNRWQSTSRCPYCHTKGRGDNCQNCGAPR